MTLLTALRLGRVSNLPTVWTNVIAASALCDVAATPGMLVLLSLAMTLAYVGGMYLNDAFDSDFDARTRPERPIPSGQVPKRTVLIAGFTMLALGILLTGLATMHVTHGPWHASTSALALAATIVFYDLHHKQNPLSPVVMGACRVLVYVTTAYALLPSLPSTLWLGAAALWSYLIGLSYAAKQETLGRIDRAWPLLFLALPVAVLGYLHHARSNAFAWLFIVFGAYALSFLLRKNARNIPRAVSYFIAGISLLDAALTASTGQTLLAALCVLGGLITLGAQRHIAGT